MQCAGHNLVCKYRLGNMMGEDRTGVCENGMLYLYFAVSGALIKMCYGRM